MDAIDAATCKLFQQVDVSCFHKLLVDWKKVVTIMDDLGGASVFGSWASWGCPFAIMQSQEKWDGNAFEQQRIAMIQHRSLGTDGNMGRLSVCRMTERVDIHNLEFYAAAGTDRRQSLFQAYIRRVRGASPENQFLSAIDVEYYDA